MLTLEAKPVLSSPLEVEAPQFNFVATPRFPENSLDTQPTGELPPGSSESAASLAQLVEAMRGAEQLFQQAFRLAVSTRDREIELLQRAEAAEREVRHQQREAQEWKERFQQIDQKLPWWVRKLLRVP